MLQTNRKRAFGLGLVAVCVLLLTACPQDVVTRVATVERDFAATVEAAQATEIAAYHAGKISASEHKAIEGYFLQLAPVGQQVDKAILAGNKAGILAALDSALASVDTLLNQGVGNVHDPTVQAELKTAVLLAQATLASAKAFIQ